MDWLQLSWKLLVARGVLGIAFGIAAMVWPLSTAMALVVLWGFWALFDGLGSLVAAVRVAGVVPKIMFAVVGVLACLAAVLAFTRPGLTAVTLTWLLGIWLVVRGVLELAATLAGARVGPVGLGLLSSALSIVAGVIFAANPGRSALALAFWLGLVALLWGLAFLVAGLLARREVEQGTAGQSAPVPPA